LGLLAATVLVALLVHAVVEERREDLAVLLALGADARALTGAVIREAVSLAAVGAMLGSAAGLVLRVVLDHVLPVLPLAFDVAAGSGGVAPAHLGRRVSRGPSLARDEPRRMPAAPCPACRVRVSALQPAAATDGGGERGADGSTGRHGPRGCEARDDPHARSAGNRDASRPVSARIVRRRGATGCGRPRTRARAGDRPGR